jgi:dihydrolipoamide dehydrogenase
MLCDGISATGPLDGFLTYKQTGIRLWQLNLISSSLVQAPVVMWPLSKPRNWGCIPTKAMLRSAEILRQMQRAKEFGLKADNIGYELGAVVARSRSVAGQLSSGISHLMKKNKISVIAGEATLVGQAQVSVKSTDGTQTVSAKNIIIATGARARELAGLEADGELVWNYKHALHPKRTPKKLLVIGSGAIGVEFASFYNTLGSAVTIVEVSERILPAEDDESQNWPSGNLSDKA